MKRVSFLVAFALSVLVLLISNAGISTALCRPLAVSQANPQQSAAQMFTGTITKSGDNFKLEDTTNKMSYMLDDTQRASKFEGKKVMVTGTFDAKTQMIHVESIQIAS